jgi:hypothetical protein
MDDQDREDFRQLLTEMRAVTGRLAAVESKLSSREEICAMHRAEVAGIRREIDGNGKPGLKALLENLTRRMDKSDAQTVAWASAGGFIGSGALMALANLDKIKMAFTLFRGG